MPASATFARQGSLTAASGPSREGRKAAGVTSARAKMHAFDNCALSTVLQPTGDDSSFTGTKIMATIGPSIHDVDIMSQLLEAGLVAGRVDLTWGPLEFHRNSLRLLEEASKRTRRLAATVIDTMGREIMIRGQWQVNDQGYPWVLGRNEVKAGQQITITTREDVQADESTLPIMYDKFASMTQAGDTIYVARYLVSGAESSSLYLQVKEVTDTDVICVAQNSAVLEGLLCVFHAERSTGGELQNMQNELPVLSDWDKHCIAELGSEFEIDFINVSYCRCVQDLRDVHQFLQSVGMNNTKVIAKAILSEADGIIISRGNLGLDVEPEKMALVQKTLIQACNLVGKPVLLTRVVDTMVHTPRPTRAEATDVANAVLDGVDGIVLGAETLRGSYPVDTVKTVSSICRSAEAVFDHDSHYMYLIDAAWEAVEQAAAQPGSNGTSMADSGTCLANNGADSEAEQESLAAQMVHNARPTDLPGQSPLAKRGSFTTAVKAMAGFSMVSSHANLMTMSKQPTAGAAILTAEAGVRSPYLSKLESIASSAVRAADKVQASLIVVYTHTGQTAEMVAKYRPPVPILTLVVPHLVSDSLKWKLEGRNYARQCLITRGLMPFLAAPFPDGDALLEDGLVAASRMGLIKAHDHVVVVQRVHEDFCVKIVGVDETGKRIRRM